ncbi:papain fold toxin domain-containing protein [Geminocystis sp. GBBB08]|uniref:papain fold toxin domain-containing protein n=1 Tax=Geminocystis sp. GBBB08 TaxID=2604140 RepID=UPI0027E2EF87|nr:papain fold toxin domain-containing protein [Geminocystis sp. GBBB08]MBL1209137.1 hypothetical protein [Geminocystis sp. GBBB08]
MSNEQIRQQIVKIATQFSIFQCQECANQIEQFLRENKLNGKRIKLNTGNSEVPYGNIYHEGLQQNISTNGHHQGICVIINSEELVFDNIHHQGIPKEIWLNNFYCPIKDFGGNFQVIEIEF